MKYIVKRLVKRTRSRTDLHVGAQTVIGPDCTFHNRSNPNTVWLNIGEKSLIHGPIVLERAAGKVSIGDRTYIGGGVSIICASSIRIG